ncbi:IS630 family transposase [endosymbiont GvMRE of Glomus versiforme]|uniref:IS630 family transposase n=1 Tax=endosymbiont GvMRE of Glomus versiforme TaxID=2039283 RepID=UPI000ED57938|nr:IS630 family transposase [endosymbiont GvMRE of Glomus versiforme]RHZ35801.1 Transposase [endosymbiont GvMRE of Glomus versiforme]RHZ37573.1 Transposase [endosymbiont GvMRE of Glomus versiforme]
MSKVKPTPQQITKLLERFTPKELADIFEVNEKTIRNWKRENNEPKKKRGRKSKIRGTFLIDLIFSLWIENKTATQQEMANYISKKMGQKVSRYTILRTLKKYEITRKKLTNHYSEQAKHIRRISKFKKIIARLTHPRILALDECSFHLNETPRYGYSHKSSRASYKKPGRQGDNNTLILCIQNVANKGVIHYELIEKGMKTKNFHNFLTNLQLLNNKKHYLLLDNLSVHRAKKSCLDLKLTTIEELLKSKNIKPLYLPSYTPEFNPAELCFNFIRQQVEKNKPRTYEELKLVIDKIIVDLNQKDMAKYFEHCANYDFRESSSKASGKIIDRLLWGED